MFTLNGKVEGLSDTDIEYLKTVASNGLKIKSNSPNRKFETIDILTASYGRVYKVKPVNIETFRKRLQVIIERCREKLIETFDYMLENQMEVLKRAYLNEYGFNMTKLDHVILGYFHIKILSFFVENQLFPTFSYEDNSFSDFIDLPLLTEYVYNPGENYFSFKYKGYRVLYFRSAFSSFNAWSEILTDEDILFLREAFLGGLAENIRVAHQQVEELYFKADAIHTYAERSVALENYHNSYNWLACCLRLLEVCTENIKERFTEKKKLVHEYLRNLNVLRDTRTFAGYTVKGLLAAVDSYSTALSFNITGEEMLLAEKYGLSNRSVIVNGDKKSFDSIVVRIGFDRERFEQMKTDRNFKRHLLRAILHNLSFHRSYIKYGVPINILKISSIRFEPGGRSSSIGNLVLVWKIKDELLNLT